MIDLNKLVEIKFHMKTGGCTLVTTRICDICDFNDNLNNLMDKAKKNEISKDELSKFSNSYYTFDDYKKNTTVCINTDSIQWFEIPFFNKDKDEVTMLKYQF